MTNFKSRLNKICNFVQKVQRQKLTSFSFNFAYNNIVVFSITFSATILSLLIIFSLTGKVVEIKNCGFYLSFLAVLLALVGIFPVSYFAYLFYKRERTQPERIKNDLKLLGLVSKQEYNDFDKVYKTVYDPIQFGAFILLLTSILTLFFTIYYINKLDINNIKLLTSNQLEIIFYAFLGAYLFGIRLVIRRYNTFDIQSQVYATIVLRILVSVVIAFGMGSLIEQGHFSSSEKSQESTKASDGRSVQQQNPSSQQQIPDQDQSNANSKKADPEKLLPWQILAFLVGFFPEQGLRWVVLVGKRAFRDPTLYQYNELPLRKILGINEWHQSRLEELGIDDVQSLATADISKLLLTTQFDTMQVINWIDQAILHMKTGTRTEQFIAFQITTYHELYTLLNQIKLYQLEVTQQGRNNYSQDVQNKTQQNQKNQEFNQSVIIDKLISRLDEIISHHKPTTLSERSLSEDYSKLLVGLGFNLTELERLCDYSNYPNYVRIEEYYKNLENITREQAKRGTKEIIRSIDFGGEVVDLIKRNYRKGLTSQQKQVIENQVSRISEQLLFSRPTHSSAEAWVQLGIRYYLLNKLDDALEAYKKSLEIDLQVTAYIGRSLIYIAQGNQERDRENEKEKDPKKKSNEINNSKNEIQPQKNNAKKYYEKAISDNTFAIGIDPYNADAFNNRALAYMEQGNLVTALENLEIALRYNDSLATAYYNRGTIKNTLGTSEKDFLEAAFDLERAYLLGYRPAALWATWGLVLLNTGHYQEAVEKFSQAIALSDENSTENSDENPAQHYNPALYYARRGFAYVQLSKEGKMQNLNYSSEYVKQASRDFDRAIELYEKLAITYIHYGDIKIFECKYDDAIENYKKAIENGSEYYIVYANLAEAYFQRAQFKKRESTDPIDDYEKSIENYKKAIEQKDERPKTFFNLAVAYHTLAVEYYMTHKIDQARKQVSESNKMIDKVSEKVSESDKYDSNLEIDKLKQSNKKLSEILERSLKKA